MSPHHRGVRRRAFVALALVAGITMLAPSRAAACLCGSRSDDPEIPGDLAFVGVVAARDEPNLLSLFDPPSFGSGVAYTFAVEEVLKGNAGNFATIRSGIGGGDCGIPMAVGERWRIYASLADGEYWVSICGPSQLVAAGVPVPLAPPRLNPIWVVAFAALAIAGVGLAIRRRPHSGDAA